MFGKLYGNLSINIFVGTLSLSLRWKANVFIWKKSLRLNSPPTGNRLGILFHRLAVIYRGQVSVDILEEVLIDSFTLTSIRLSISLARGRLAEHKITRNFISKTGQTLRHSSRFSFDSPLWKSFFGNGNFSSTKVSAGLHKFLMDFFAHNNPTKIFPFLNERQFPSA